MKKFIAAIILYCAIITVYAGKKKIQLSPICLGCICDAASGCNTTIGCSGGTCGPFRITELYWSDSGKPKLGGETGSDSEAFMKCVNDVTCSSRAVQGYMQKYSKDCNGDGSIDCDDYARIHHLGGYGCNGRLSKKYAKKFNYCKRAFQ